MDQGVIDAPKDSYWNRVTPFPKYLAMGIFIVSPFLGGWVGYHYASEKGTAEQVLLTEGKEIQVPPTERNERVEEVRTESDLPVNYQAPKYGEFVKVNPNTYPSVNKQYFDSNPSRSEFSVPDSVAARRAQRLTPTIVLLEVYGSDGGPFVTYLLYDESASHVTRETFQYPALTVTHWYDNSKLIYIGGAVDTIVLYDYITDVSKTLYKESDPTVQLVEVWESAASGPLHTEGDEVIFSRYRKQEGTTVAEFVEEVRVDIPVEFLSKEF